MSSDKDTFKKEAATELTSINPVSDHYDKVEEEAKRESFCRLFCCGTNKRGCCVSVCDRAKSIFERRPSSLQPLDGLRAFAVMQVVGLHAFFMLHENMAKCLKLH